MRGGDDFQEATPRPGSGRSPRARGRRKWHEPNGGKARSIPACAGETWQTAGAKRAHRVDPRVRGGDPSAKAAPRRYPGRSPRARGRPYAGCCPRSNAGSIPACAGETPVHTPGIRTWQVDPRVRGGDASAYGHAAFSMGRSPRARGRRSNQRRPTSGVGSIPACAGETFVVTNTAADPEVDPRVRGGDRNSPPPQATVQGRSPRARGRRSHHPS